MRQINRDLIEQNRDLSEINNELVEHLYSIADMAHQLSEDVAKIRNGGKIEEEKEDQTATP